MTREWEEAARRGACEVLEHLLNDGADIDARDRHGNTALMIGATEGHARLVEWLVERGAALDHTAKYGLSALMLAVIRGHVEIVRTLTAAGASRALRGSGAPGFAGKTALDLARARNDVAMVTILDG